MAGEQTNNAPVKNATEQEQAVKDQITAKRNALQREIEKEQAKKAEPLTEKKEDAKVSPEKPEAEADAVAAEKALVEAIKAPKAKAQTNAAPEGKASRMSNVMGKIVEFIKEIEKFLSGLGYDTLKMLGGMFDSKKGIGLLLGNLKDTPKSHGAYMEKELAGRTLDAGLTYESIAERLHGEVLKKNSAGGAKPHDNFTHIQLVLGKIRAQDKNPLELKDFIAASEEVFQEIPAKAATPSTPSATVEAPKKGPRNVDGTGESVQISKDGDTIGVFFNEKTTKVKVGLKEAKITNIAAGDAISKVEVRDIDGTEAAKVIFTVEPDAAQIQVLAQKFKEAAASDLETVKIEGMNMSTNNPISFEVKFKA